MKYKVVLHCLCASLAIKRKVAPYSQKSSPSSPGSRVGKVPVPGFIGTPLTSVRNAEPQKADVDCMIGSQKAPVVRCKWWSWFHTRLTRR
ncbi:hypothetical protein M378DRAFT_170559 [Amanita muscaria Koide BX008]|uniref:Uncharacterized protein n=1 Tax=Amanita muscaria (strain Koide BX008) TaxID=946122 RepID=A0A0C2WQF8_AMAMK|nr:hypothetical protein M378DRAFT_170559 [Amanita muscaria Koide BX008]